METKYTVIEGKSRGYRVLVIALGIGVILFFTAFMVSYLVGQQIWDTNNAIPWGQLITFFIYFIGLSAGAIVISALSYVLHREEYKPIGRIAVYLGLLLMVGAVMIVLIDLGRPEKFWRLFVFGITSNMTSMFAVNGIFYGVYIVLMAFYLWLVLEGKTKLASIVGMIDVGWAVLVHTGTGAIFGLIGSREILFSPIKPFEFVTAALTSGTSLLIIVAAVVFKFTRRELNDKVIPGLGKLLSYIIIVLAVMVFFDKLAHSYYPDREGVLFLFTGPYWWLFWILQVGMGIVLPLVILFHPRLKKDKRFVILAAVSVVIGVFGERAAIVLPAMAQVQPLFPGDIQGIWGTAIIFPITFWESVLSLGIVCLVALLFVLGLRYLELLPEAAVKVPEPSEKSTTEIKTP